MSSIDKNIKNNIKITLFQSVICRNSSNYIPYNILINYNDTKEYETEQIETSNKKFINKSYNFNISTFSRKQNHTITLSAYTRSLFVIKKTFSKLNIPIKINNNNNKQKQWFYLKDNNDEIVLKILLSIDLDISLYQNNSMNHLNRSYRGEISYDLINQKSNFNDSNILNITTLNLNNIQSNNKSMINLNENNFRRNTNQNQLISILENESDNVTITYSDDDKSENEESDLSINKINNIISQRADKILEEQKNHDNKIEELKNDDLSIIKKNNILIKENEKLKTNIRILEKSKQIYETKIINHSENLLDFERTIQRYNIQKDLDEYNKEIFYNLNSMFIFNTNEIILNNKNNIKYEKNLKKKIKNKNSNFHSNISINIDLNEVSITQNSKKLKKEYLTSKHLNSTNFTSIYSNESIINKHHSPSSNNIYESRTRSKNQINSHSKNSLDIDNIYSIYEIRAKTTKKELIDLDNLKVIRIKTSNSKSNIIQSNKGGRKTLRHTKKRPSLNSLSKSNANTFNLSKPKKYPSEKNNNYHFIPNKIERNGMNYINCSSSNIISNVNIKNNISPSTERIKNS